jgi:methenyltetrahydrofolate cyclohydrolase
MSTGEMTVGTFLDALAARESTPGGGGAAAVTGSQAAALLSMVAQFTLGNPKYDDVAQEMGELLAQTEALRMELLTLADQDVAAFQGVTACYAMPRKSDEEKAARTAALQAALKRAARVPYETAELSLHVLELAAPLGSKGNSNVVSDAAVALYLGMAALQSAVINVNINLKFIKDEDFVAEWSAKRDELLANARTAFAAGQSACSQSLGMPV